jgi:hypothetical protein
VPFVSSTWLYRAQLNVSGNYVLQAKWREASCKLDGWTHRDLTLALLERVESKNAVMLDSSKTAWGSATAPFGFRRTLGRHFHLVHLVRNPRAVCWSTVRRAERRVDRLNGALRCAFTTLGWWTANLACELFSWMYPDQYVRLHYEDLARAPHEAVSRLLTALLVEGQPQFEALGKSANRHQLYGNRMRRYPPHSANGVEGWGHRLPDLAHADGC